MSGDSSLPAHRSPFTLVEVEPLEDARSSPEAIAARQDGRKAARAGEETGQGNIQLYKNGMLKDSEMTAEYLASPDCLYGSKENPPNFEIIEEKPEHRLICYLKAQCLSNREIAQRTGYTEAWVSQICRQPWFKLRLVQELKDAGVDAVQTMIRASALDSVLTLVELRDDKASPKAVRKAAADSLLDRFLGKPTQKFESEKKPTPTNEEIASLDQQIKEIDAQLENKNENKD